MMAVVRGCGGGDDDTGGNQDSPISSSQTMETASRWRPEEGLAALSQATKFSRSELKLMYRGFKQECPTGLMTELEFRDIYAKFFPMGDCSQYAKYVFSTLDKEGDGVVSFGTVIRVLSLLFRGSVHDRLHWLFSLYDVNRDGFISRADVADVVESIYGILGSGNTVPQVDEAGCRQHAERVFLRLLSRNNASSSSSSEFISERDFVEHCLKDVQLQESLGVFDDPW
ncbi:unnamed protein product [Notodromas monacha]|uniref:EF-hand domain-containing protein n=1 Tax=Notodromas monacha TaxID=399045 RepID=A0A7R9GFB9_9CRUS|nr:unnamed protein product [Notodromas monacha]CAG0918670.1 unnamed protein product [Notodromas monacha]